MVGTHCSSIIEEQAALFQNPVDLHQSPHHNSRSLQLRHCRVLGSAHLFSNRIFQWCITAYLKKTELAYVVRVSKR